MAACLALALALGGCAGDQGRPAQGRPAQRRPAQRRPAASSPLQQAERTHEYPSPAPPRESAPGNPSAIQAVSAFATAYINWTAQTVSGQMSVLARVSVGQARSAMILAAAQTADDYELQRGGVSNQGTVEAVAPLAGHRGEYVVVTRELTTATDTTVYQGLQPAWHVTVATVTQLAPGQWVLSGWQPES
jgi:hypothetical protein